MSSFVKTLAKGDVFTRTFGSSSAVANILHPAGKLLDNAAKGKPTTLNSVLDPAGAFIKQKGKPPPGVPTIDDAAVRVQQDDRLRKRRGALANIYAGNAAAPSVGKPTLGG
jgi:hypothetical protein